MRPEAERPPALDVSGLTVSYARPSGRLRALSDVTLRVERGETYGLVGESGSGKTTLALTLLRHLPRAARVDGGRVLLGGDDLLGAGERTLRRWRARRISMVPQGAGTALNPSLQVGTQIGEVYRAHAGMLPAEAAEASARMLTEVRIGDPARVLGRYPHELSAGQQQRVLIAMALAANPEVLVLDEPTTALDATVEAEVLDLIEALQGELDAAIVLVSHDVRVVARLCDRVGMLYSGRLLEEGPVEEVLRAPRHPYTLALLRCVPRLDADGASLRLEPIPGRPPEPGSEPEGCVFAGRCPLVRPRCLEEAPPALPVADGWTSRCHFHPEVPALDPGTSARNGARPPLAAAPLLRVSGVSKTYLAADTRIEAVADVSLELGYGEVLGLVGESGSGKSSLARCIAGLTEPSAGSLELDGHAVPWSHSRRSTEQRRAVQMVFQNSAGALNRAVTVGRTLRRSLRRLAGERAASDAALHELATLVHLSPGDLDLRPTALSGGMKQRAAIARSFAGAPRLVICDEPVSDLDVSVQVAILNLVRDLREQAGVSYLFISHDLAVVRYVADRVGVMYLGSLVELGPVATLFEPPHHPYTEALISAMPTMPSDEQRPRITLYGPLPSPSRPPSGCRFHTRCPRFLGDVCRTVEPPWQDDGHGQRYRCHIAPEALAGLQRADRLAGRAPARPEVWDDRLGGAADPLSVTA
ncbi:MAG: oligopeptide/dipeptide transporter, ATPase subunit [Gaiellaceae bacterium]|nr:oligopeptide/dipeptide transporter, ATPase subunit [Gaiellaceae bacterium]